MASELVRREGRASSIHPKGDRHLEVAKLGEREVITVVLVHGWRCTTVHRLTGGLHGVKEESSRARWSSVRGGGEVQKAKCDQFGDGGHASRHRRLSVLLVSCDRHVGRSTEYLLLTSNLSTPTRIATEVL